MTEQRIRRLQKKIRDSRERLMDTAPFFALLLMYLRFVAATDIRTISTNGRCIFFSPDFLEKLYEWELDYILCHEILHIVEEDIWRPEDLAGYDYHFACDVRLNLLLKEGGFEEEHFPHLGSFFRKFPSLKMYPTCLSPEEIRQQLPFSLYLLPEQSRRRFLPDADEYWDRKGDDGREGTLILDVADEDGFLRRPDGAAAVGESEECDDGGDGGETGAQRLKQAWQGRARAIEKSLANARCGKDAGSAPAFLRRLIMQQSEPKVNWQKILNSYFREQICDYSFSPPDRRFTDTGFFLPDFNEKEYISRDILFMVDTSGSVKDDDLAAVYAEIKGALSQFSGKLSGQLGFFDAAVTPPVPFENVNDLARIIPVGGGGTDFCPIFEYVRLRYRGQMPACIVIFTDGDGPYPDESAAMGIPVLWLINNNRSTPPWGKTVRILSASADAS